MEFLRRKHAASAEAIAAELKITPNAVRQHLTNLEREGLVKSEPVRARRGRPSLQFSLTERADAVFPKRYGQLATMVLAELREMQGERALDDLFRRIAVRHAAAMEHQIDGLDFDQKVQKIVAWINRAGTLAEAREFEGGVRITIHNCPFRNTALKFPQVCSITPHLIVELLGAPVSQDSSIHRNDPYCSFLVQRDNERPPDSDRLPGS